MKRETIKTGILALAVLSLPLFFGATVHADRFTSTNYTIDASAVGNSVGGAQNSTSYNLVSSGGESVIGNAASGSYKLTQGYVAQLEHSLEFTVTPPTLTIPAVTPNTSQIVNLSATVLTDAAGYTLSANQDTDLTRSSGGNTIPAVSGSIASPVTWSEGTTKGFGFSLVSTTGTAIPGKWNAGASYAAFPLSATSFYTRTGLSGGVTDTLNMRVRLDVATSQVTGSYSNTVTWLGTLTP